MPGSAIMSPSSIDQGEMMDDAPKRKKGMLGRIKSKLTKNLGLRKSNLVASPKPADLLKTEPETPELATKEQQDDEDVLNDGKEDLHPEEIPQQYQTSETEVASLVDDYQVDVVQQFQGLSTASNNHQLITDLKRSIEEDEQQHSESPEQTDKEDEDGDEMEVFAAHEEEKEALNSNDSPSESAPEQAQIAGEAVEDTPEDDEDTLEIFGGSQENQQHHSPREPEEDDENQGNDSEPSAPNADLVIIGVTPLSLRNGPTLDDTARQEFQEEEEPLDMEPDVVLTPRVSESLSSLLKRVRLGPGVEVICPKAPFSSSSTLPHPPLHEIREEDESTSGGRERTRAVPARFQGRRQFSEILASTSSVSSPTENDIEEKAEDEQCDSQAEPDAFDVGALITREFGERIVNLLAAEPWGDRQDGFDAIKLAVKSAKVSTIDPISRQRLLCASLSAVQCGVEDRVAPVMFCALECFRSVLKEFSRVLPDDRTFADTKSTSAAALNTQLSALVGALVRRLGDSNKRTQRETTQALVRIARLRSLRGLPHLLLHLSGREVPARKQLETLRRLMVELGLSTQEESPSKEQQLTVETVLEFVAPSLKITKEKTRKVAVEILADVQMRTNNSTAWHAQLARVGAVKPEMLRGITRRVEELIAKREQEQATASSSAAATGSGATNQAEEQVDDEAAFPPAELVDVPQGDSQSSIALLEAAMSNAENVVGPVCWRKLASKSWSDRKEALLEIEKAMTEAKSDLRDIRPAFGGVAQGPFVAYSTLLRRALSDSIAPVVNAALDTFVTLVRIYGPRVEWREAAVREITLLTLLQLFAVMQKTNTRMTRAACRGILKLARLPNARHPLRYVLSCVFGGEGSNACDPQVQMHLLRLLVPEFGFQADGLGASRVLDAVCKGLMHNSARVRRSAADVALSAQRLLGREFVLARLQGVKPVTLKELEKSFVDGVGGDRPHTVHAITAEAATSVAIAGLDLPPVSFGGPGDFPSRRLLNSAPVGVGRLHCTPEVSESSSPQTRASVLSNDEENLMDSILDSF